MRIILRLAKLQNNICKKRKIQKFSLVAEKNALYRYRTLLNSFCGMFSMFGTPVVPTPIYFTILL